MRQKALRCCGMVLLLGSILALALLIHTTPTQSGIVVRIWLPSPGPTMSR